MPVPINDVIAAMRVNAEKTETALQKVSNAYSLYAAADAPTTMFFSSTKTKTKT